MLQKHFPVTGAFVLPAGGAEEQAAAATLFILLCIQLSGGDEADECFKMLLPILTTILMDNSASVAAQQSVSGRADQLKEDSALIYFIFLNTFSPLCVHQCARALGLCTYICIADDGEVRRVVFLLFPYYTFVLTMPVN